MGGGDNEVGLFLDLQEGTGSVSIGEIEKLRYSPGSRQWQSQPAINQEGMLKFSSNWSLQVKESKEFVVVKTRNLRVVLYIEISQPRMR